MLRDSRVSPVPFTLPGGQACVLQSPASGGDGRVMVLVHNPPLDDKDNPLLQHLALRQPLARRAQRVLEVGGRRLGHIMLQDDAL